jgi:hypothetical protein
MGRAMATGRAMGRAMAMAMGGRRLTSSKHQGKHQGKHQASIRASIGANGTQKRIVALPTENATDGVAANTGFAGICWTWPAFARHLPSERKARKVLRKCGRICYGSDRGAMARGGIAESMKANFHAARGRSCDWVLVPKLEAE